MTFVSTTTLAILAASVVLYWAVPRRFQLLALSAAAAGVLGVYSWPSLAILAALTGVTFACARQTRARTGLVLFTVAASVAGFALYRVWSLPSATGELTAAVLLGFAFYMLRVIHYLVESLQGRLPPHEFEHYLGYMFFLPTLTAGPIHRFPDFMRETRRRRWDPRQFSEGLERVVFGYGKIVVLGNYLVSTRLALYIEALPPERAGWIAYLECLQYGLNLYFQFAGYSDVAIGVSRMLGIRVVENFDWPFLQKNISEFWNCWHISLSSWCRDYVYMPVVAQTRRPAVAVVSSMLVLGLWHEFTLRYVLWAFYHGLGIVGWRVFQGWKERLGLPTAREGWQRRVVDGVAILATFHFVLFSFAITKESDIRESLRVYGDLLSLATALFSYT